MSAAHASIYRYTVDDLCQAAPRCQVIDGCLLVPPIDSRRHERVVANLTEVWIRLLPAGPETLASSAVRLDGGDGPVPDLLVTTAGEQWGEHGLPATDVHTVVEVVSPWSAHLDRARKPELYANAGIPCYWRIELDPWRRYRGPLPLVVARLRESTGWRHLVAPAGRIVDLPVAIGPGRVVWIPLDPAILATPRSGTVPGGGLISG
jgi:Uma2 family endonuclease